MALRFAPFVTPQDVLATQPQKPDVGAQASEGIKNAINVYLQLKKDKEAEAAAKQQRNIELAKNLSDYGTNFIDTLNQISGNTPLSLVPQAKNPSPTVPSITPTPTATPPPTPAAPLTAGTVARPTGNVVTQAPPQTPTPPTVQSTSGTASAFGNLSIPKTPLDITPDHLAEIQKQSGKKGLDLYLDKNKAIDTALGVQDRLDTSAQKKIENEPKSFDYARAMAKAAGEPDAAESFIKLAQQDGRDKLNKRELDDLMKSINAGSMQFRGQYFNTMGDIASQKLRDSLVKEARTTLNPLFQTGAGKEQAGRLFTIGRAEPLVSQMLSQPDGGDPRQMVELATTMDRVIKGSGASAQAQIEHLIPQTARGKYASWLEWFKNNPQGTEQQAFIKRYADTLSREKTAIQGQVRANAEHNAPTLRVLKENYPQDYDAVLKSVLENPTYGGGEVGATTDAAAPAAPPPSQGMIRIQDSTGALHDIPKGNLEKAQKIDPSLKVVQ